MACSFTIIVLWTLFQYSECSTTFDKKGRNQQHWKQLLVNKSFPFHLIKFSLVACDMFVTADSYGWIKAAGRTRRNDWVEQALWYD